jgi:hypothetical protein
MIDNKPAKIPKEDVACRITKCKHGVAIWDMEKLEAHEKLWTTVWRQKFLQACILRRALW